MIQNEFVDIVLIIRYVVAIQTRLNDGSHGSLNNKDLSSPGPIH